jgi:hypothetical protein
MHPEKSLAHIEHLAQFECLVFGETPTEQAYFVSITVVFHQESVSVHDMSIEVPRKKKVSVSQADNVGRLKVRTNQATASSKIWAAHSKNGDTIPGAK